MERVVESGRLKPVGDFVIRGAFASPRLGVDGELGLVAARQQT